MYQGNRILCVITARGGSKGLPNKNLRELCGKPLIAWSIDAARKSLYIDHILVSTDSPQIQKCAMEFGADAPFLRPAELASDTASSVDAVIHAMEQMKDAYNYIILLQPTSPLRSTTHIDESIEKIICQQADALISVTELEKPIQHQRQLSENGHLIQFMEYDKKKLYRRQDFKPVYRINGAIYMIKSSTLKEIRDFEPQGTISYIMDTRSSVDIDCLEDFLLAEFYLENKQNH